MDFHFSYESSPTLNSEARTVWMLN